MDPAINHGANVPNLTDDKFHRLMDYKYELCKEDIIWLLNYIKQKAADEDPALLGLQQPRLLKNFQHYAEAAMLMLSHSRNTSSIQEYSHIRYLLREASYGLH